MSLDAHVVYGTLIIVVHEHANLAKVSAYMYTVHVNIHVHVP